MTTEAKKGAAKAKTTAVARWDEALAARARMAAKAVANVGGNADWISFKNGQITFKDNVIGKSLEVVIPSFVLENAFYEGEYDPNNPKSPDCYAFGTDDAEMAPYESVESPCHVTCEGCPNNEWDTGKDGRGKACKNQIRLACLPADCQHR